MSRPQSRLLSSHWLAGLLAAVALLGGCERSQPIASPLPETVALARGTCPIIHCNTWQTDALPLKGPEAILALLARPVLPLNTTLTAAVPPLSFLQAFTPPLTP